jgi:hypothetical protein
MKRALILLALAGCHAFDCAEWTSNDPAPKPRAGLEMPAAELEDRIRGGLLGQIFGNLNGLPHEFKYIAEPGQVETYVPSLPDGAFTDDDTDIEWVYVSEMARTGELYLPPARIAELWTSNMNDRIWCANLYARQLMDLGIEPPLTGRHALNPWATFNISAQFLSEAFGLAAPGMPRTAAKLGAHYVHTAVDGEPVQTTQLFAGMIATAFFEPDVRKVVDAGRRMLDPKSAVGPIIDDVLRWWTAHPDDWRATRRQMKEKYTKHGGSMRDRNGYELNTAAIVGALLHGRGEFAETLRLAFNFGWDSDCNAATCGAILGVMKGKRWMDERGWVAKDVYKNTCRPGMPKDETITGYGDKLVAVARKVILANGGTEAEGLFRIPREAPGCVEPLEARAEIRPDGLGPAARGYVRLCRNETPVAEEVEALKTFPKVIREIYNAPHATGAAIQKAAKDAGIEPPPQKK